MNRFYSLFKLPNSVINLPDLLHQTVHSGQYDLLIATGMQLNASFPFRSQEMLFLQYSF